MATLPVVRKLPKAYLQAIGALCFEWAQIERALRQITFGVLKVGPKHGRIAVRTPRGYEQLVMIRQLMHLEKFTSRQVNLDKLATVLERLEKDRDMFAHGTWMWRKKGRKREILIQVFAGTWRPDPKEPRVPRRMHPEGIIVHAEEMLGAAEQMRVTFSALEELGKDLGMQIALRAAQPQQSPPLDPPEAPIPDKP